ncbi:hypothetical protein AVEN_116615-1 [Araneus ventricosus]|uniref:Uncharacterized protein n=1 Tax=Araneus ventricosus TaxID=182803 RepID=A0A4Y2DG24_ARAVE|nr:hypothetical protein AVEN_116615-1 [Araneus ventricosus]
MLIIILQYPNRFPAVLDLPPYSASINLHDFCLWVSYKNHPGLTRRRRLTVAAIAGMLRLGVLVAITGLPDPSHRRLALSPADNTPKPLLYTPGKGDPAFLSGGF